MGMMSAITLICWSPVWAVMRTMITRVSSTQRSRGSCSARETSSSRLAALSMMKMMGDTRTANTSQLDNTATIMSTTSEILLISNENDYSDTDANTGTRMLKC